MSYHQVYINERPVQFVALKNSQRAKIEKGYLIAGEEDQANGAVSFRFRDGTQKNGIPAKDAIAEILQTIKDRKQV